MITDLEPDILECEVKWVLESIIMNKATRGDGIPVELFQILKDDAVKYASKFGKLSSGHTTGKGVFIPNPKNAKSLQECPTLCDPIDGSPPGSPIPGILQARTLEWAAISFSNA